MIAQQDETANKTTNNEIQAALATLSANIQDMAVRLDKIETKPTVAVITKAGEEPEKQHRRNRGQPKTKNFNVIPQQALMPINAYNYQQLYNLMPTTINNLKHRQSII